MTFRRTLAAGSLLALAGGLATWCLTQRADASVLRIATWNLQWLVDPATARQARIACRDHRAAALPCDVARELARDSADLGRLAATARALDADVIAFQEVESAAIARRVFRGYRICLAPGPGVQHVGFAVRRDLRHRCEAPVLDLAAQQGRAGALLTLQLPNGPTVELLAVHLKSGCAHTPLDTTTPACQLLAAQAQALGRWVAPRVAAQRPFIVAGDFNRRWNPDPADAFWSQLGSAGFVLAATHLPFRNCVFGAPYGEFIDHILVSQALLPYLQQDGFRQHRFTPAEVTRFRLSDHCPVSVSLTPTPAL